MSMKKLIESMDNIEECGMNASADPAMAPQPADEGMPVSMNISLNASGEKNVQDLIKMMKNAGLQDAEPVTPAMMPMRQDMERLNAIVSDPEDQPDMEPSVGQEEMVNAGYDNAPDPEYSDHQMMTKDLSGGLNREKGSHKPVAGGDNPMQESGQQEGDYYDDDLQGTVNWVYDEDGEFRATFSKSGDVDTEFGPQARDEEYELDGEDLERAKDRVDQDMQDAEDDRGDAMMHARQDDMMDDDETTYAIKGKSPEAQGELARKATAMENSIKSKLFAALSEKKKQPDLNDDGKNDFKDVQIARKNAAAKAAAKKK
jgi:hypothetical protein